MQCYNKYVSRPKESFSRPCRRCQKIINRGTETTGQWTRKMYCSSECKELNREFDRLRGITCGWCKNPVPDGSTRYVKNYVFCSRECFFNHRNSITDFTRTYGFIDKSKSDRIYGKSCVVCGFERTVDRAHIIPGCKGGTIHPSNIVTLCPNHHRLYDRGLLDADEKSIMDAVEKIAYASETSINRNFTPIKRTPTNHRLQSRKIRTEVL